MKLRKYNYYQIRILDKENKSKLVVDNNKKDNYKSMIDLYKQTRDQYKNKDVAIVFEAVGSDESTTMFCKDNRNIEIKQTRSIDNIFNDMKRLVQELKEKEKILSNYQSYFDKEEKRIIHKVESGLSRQEKLNLLDELERVSNTRRPIKLEQKVLLNLKSKKIVDKIEDILSNIKTKEQISDVKFKEFYAAGDAENNNVIKRFKYRNQNEKINLMTKYSKFYYKVIHNSETQEIICYKN